MLTARTGVPAQPGGAQAQDIEVLVLREKGARPAAISISSSARVARLAKFARDELDLKVPSDYVELKKLDGTVLVSDRALAAEGVEDGTHIIATVMAPPQPATTGTAAALSQTVSAAAVSTRLPSLSAHEVELFLYKPEFEEFRRKLIDNNLKERDVPTITRRLRTVVETSTRHRMTMESGIVLDGPIRVASSQASTSLLFAIQGTAVKCAKVGPVAAIQHEHQVYSEIHSIVTAPTLCLPTDAFRIPGGDRMALIIPLYNLTVADATFSMAIGHSVARSVLAINVALCGLASMFALNSAGYAHGDIKPGNMMLDSSGLVTLIDLGTAQRLGDYFTESSNFALGELSLSSVDYDLVCLGSTLAFIEHALHPNDLRTRDAMLAKLSDCTSSAVTRLAQQCLGPASSRPSLRQMADELESASRHLNCIVSLRAMWPTMR
jgi:hypothetical protein